MKFIDVTSGSAIKICDCSEAKFQEEEQEEESADAKRTFHVPGCPEDNIPIWQPRSSIKGAKVCPFSPACCPLAEKCPYPVEALYDPSAPAIPEKRICPLSGPTTNCKKAGCGLENSSCPLNAGKSKNQIKNCPLSSDDGNCEFGLSSGCRLLSCTMGSLKKFIFDGTDECPFCFRKNCFLVSPEGLRCPIGHKKNPCPLSDKDMCMLNRTPSSTSSKFMGNSEMSSTCPNYQTESTTQLCDCGCINSNASIQKVATTPLGPPGCPYSRPPPPPPQQPGEFECPGLNKLMKTLHPTRITAPVKTGESERSLKRNMSLANKQFHLRAPSHSTTFGKKPIRTHPSKETNKPLVKSANLSRDVSTAEPAKAVSEDNKQGRCPMASALAANQQTLNCPVRTKNCCLFSKGHCPMEDMNLCPCEYPVAPCMVPIVPNEEIVTDEQYCSNLNCCMGLPLPPVKPSEEFETDTWYSFKEVKPGQPESKCYLEMLDVPPKPEFFISINEVRKHPGWKIVQSGEGYKACEKVKQLIEKRGSTGTATTQFSLDDLPDDEEIAIIERNRVNAEEMRNKLTHALAFQT